MTETGEDADCVGIIEDIALLARKLAEREPCKSTSGPDALRTLATQLDAMAIAMRPDQHSAVSVAVRSRRKASDG